MKGMEKVCHLQWWLCATSAKVRRGTRASSRSQADKKSRSAGGGQGGQTWRWWCWGQGQRRHSRCEGQQQRKKHLDRLRNANLAHRVRQHNDSDLFPHNTPQPLHTWFTASSDWEWPLASAIGSNRRGLCVLMFGDLRHSNSEQQQRVRAGYSQGVGRCMNAGLGVLH